MSCQMIYNNPDMILRMLLFRVSTWANPGLLSKYIHKNETVE